jgi:protein-tyrosine-phosphatase
MSKKRINILFICRHNRFRSKVAEALFKKYNKNKKIKAESCGIGLDYIPVAENVIKVLKKFGVKRINRKPKSFNKGLMNKSDLIIIVANNISKKEIKEKEIKGKRIIFWKISDTSQDDYLGILRRTRIIEKRVKNLIKSLR